MKNLKTYENFSGKIKYTKPEDLDTQEVVELVGILFELKPSLPDDFPQKDLSQLIRNEVSYLSDDDRFNIIVGFSENDTYVNKEQPNTSYDLDKRVFVTWNNDPIGENDIVVEFDAEQLTYFNPLVSKKLLAV
jgi:hypothetical protein